MGFIGIALLAIIALAVIGSLGRELELGILVLGVLGAGYALLVAIFGLLVAGSVG